MKLQEENGLCVVVNRSHMLHDSEGCRSLPDDILHLCIYASRYALLLVRELSNCNLPERVMSKYILPACRNNSCSTALCPMAFCFCSTLIPAFYNLHRDILLSYARHLFVLCVVADRKRANLPPLDPPTQLICVPGHTLLT